MPLISNRIARYSNRWAPANNNTSEGSRPLQRAAERQSRLLGGIGRGDVSGAKTGKMRIFPGRWTSISRYHGAPYGIRESDLVHRRTLRPYSRRCIGGFTKRLAKPGRGLVEGTSPNDAPLLQHHGGVSSLYTFGWWKGEEMLLQRAVTSSGATLNSVE